MRTFPALDLNFRRRNIAVCRCLALVFLSVLMTAGSNPAWAGELRVVDGHGLVRAAKDVASAQRVVVKLAGKGGPVQVTLINTDGLAADRVASSNGGDQVVFDGVGEGSWRLATDPAREVGSVTIQSP